MIHKLHSNWQIYKEKMKAQRKNFQIKLKQVREKVEQLEIRSKMFEKKI